MSTICAKSIGPYSKLQKFGERGSALNSNLELSYLRNYYVIIWSQHRNVLYW